MLGLFRSSLQGDYFLLNRLHYALRDKSRRAILTEPTRVESKPRLSTTAAPQSTT
ncbi:hypothetical protein IV102_35650 [bacterium]|nr:hypothetical protein [bacterium]